MFTVSMYRISALVGLLALGACSGGDNAAAPVGGDTRDTTAPVIGNIAVTNITQTSATVSWTTNENAGSQVQYGTTAGYGSSASDALSVMNHSVPLYGLTTNVTYHFRVISADAANNTSTSANVVFRTAAVPADIMPPTVAIVAPTAGSVSGTVLISANASDNVGVVGVQFRVNGVNHGSESTTAPYAVNWHTSGLTPGAVYTLSAVARDAAGLTMTSPSVNVTVQAPPPAPQGLLFFDSFDYEVGRGDAGAVGLFQQFGRWTGGKTQQSSTGAHGYLYTAPSIPGYDGAFPGDPSGRVLVMEALPNSLGGQTDFYLQYGDGESMAYDNAVPGDVWFQFWVYVNHYGSQLSQLNAGKFIYACNAAYPCHTHKWMMTLSGRSAEPFWQSLGTPTYYSPTDGSAFMSNIANTIYPVDDPTTPENESVSTIINTGAGQGNEWKLGHTDTGEHFTANRWTLVKIHLDTSTQSGGYEAWMRPIGGAWTKTAEWISGVTPGFTWTINANHVGGHRVFRMPTTIGEANGAVTSYDAWIYLDDFAMAANEAALPQYLDEPMQ